MAENFQIDKEGEVVITSPVRAPRSKKKETKEEVKEFPAYYNEENWKFFLSKEGAVDGYQSTIPSIFNTWGNEEYLPLYSIGMPFASDVPVHEYRQIENLSNHESISLLRTPKLLHTKMPNNGLKFFLKMWNDKNYQFLMNFNDSFINPLYDGDFKHYMKQAWSSFFNQRLAYKGSTTISVPVQGNGFGVPRLVNKFKYHNDWRLTQIKQTGVSYAHQPTYLTNLGFIGRIDTSNYQIPMQMKAIQPLVCIVFKKEYYDLIKMYFVSNQSIPQGLLEMWVDKSIEEVLPGDPNTGAITPPIHNIQSSYIRQIKKVYAKYGLEANIKENLGSLIIRKPEIRKFRTFNEQEQWINNILEEFTIDMKKQLRIA